MGNVDLVCQSKSVCLLQNPSVKIVRVVVIEGVDLAKKDIFGLRYVVAKAFRQIRCCFSFFSQV